MKVVVENFKFQYYLRCKDCVFSKDYTFEEYTFKSGGYCQLIYTLYKKRVNDDHYEWSYLCPVTTREYSDGEQMLIDVLKKILGRLLRGGKDRRQDDDKDDDDD